MTSQLPSVPSSTSTNKTNRNPKLSSKPLIISSIWATSSLFTVMYKMSTQIETIVNAYKTLAKIPALVGAKLNNNGTKITAKWSVRNIDKGKTTKYQCNYLIDDNLKVISESDFGTDVSNELMSAVSPQETYRAVIKEEKDNKDVKKQYLEVWSKSTLAHSIDLTTLDLHGDVYADSEFGSLDWSQDESAIVYVAEKKLRKSEPYIKRKGEEKVKPDASGEALQKKGEEHLYRQDWGEQLVGKHLSVIVVCRLSTETFTVLNGLPDAACPGQVRFSPDGQSVVGVAWETEPRRLGLIFCTNRPGFIFQLGLDGNYCRLSRENRAVRSPRFAGDRLLWLERDVGGPHHACHQLQLKHKDNQKTIIDIVQTEKSTDNKVPFHGIYSQGLPLRCFASEQRLVFSSPQKNEIRSYVVDLESCRLVDISREGPGSTSVLDVCGDIILASYSTMTTPAQLFAGRLPAPGQEAALNWVRISEPINPPDAVASANVQYMDLTHEGSTDSVKSFTALYMAPKSNSKLPLIVWPHGGPHSGFVNAYSMEAALFTMLGFASLQINYRGSTGAGEDSLQFLPKRVGNSDVKDCKLATETAITLFGVDEKRLCLFGGSHGGFLVTHLSGQYPDTYKVVVSRNPVIDVASMFNTTDIADWCAVEGGFQFTEKGPVSEEELLALRRCSPLVHVHKVKAPTALMLGSGDKRVPMYQGIEYSRRLKANGVQTRVFVYEDNHSLSSLPVEMDNMINSAAWFMEHIQ